MIAGDHMYIFNQDGLAQVVQLGDKSGEIVGRGDFGEPIFGTPVIADGALYVRTDGHLWKIAGQSANRSGLFSAIRRNSPCRPASRDDPPSRLEEHHQPRASPPWPRENQRSPAAWIARTRASWSPRSSGSASRSAPTPRGKPQRERLRWTHSRGQRRAVYRQQRHDRALSHRDADARARHISSRRHAADARAANR